MMQRHSLRHKKSKTSRYNISGDSFYHNSLQCTKMWQPLSPGNFNSQWKRKVLFLAPPSIASQCRDSIKTLGYSFPQHVEGKWIKLTGSWATAHGKDRRV